MSHLHDALVTAICAHAGQVDKSGVPYITHPMRVAGYLTTEDEKTVALLHDVLEDTDVTESQLRDRFPGHIVDAVVALTHLPGEPRPHYYARVVRAGELAQRAKRADIRDNTDPLRAAALDEAIRTRLRVKYEKAAAALGTTVEDIHSEFGQ